MDPVLVGICVLGLFFVFVFLAVPIGFAFAITGFLGFAAIRNLDQALSLLGYIPYSWASSYMLVVIPLFVLMGQFAFHSGISGELYATAYRWVGRLPGGLAVATQVACTGFAACSGSSLASAATMGIVAIPEMEKYRYSRRLATACVAAGGTLGILIPPSVIFIIYGLLTETSIGKLFAAGILPGLILSVLFIFLIIFQCWRSPLTGPRGPHFSLQEKLASLQGLWGVLSLFALVMGGIYFGIFTATEAGAIGALGSFAIMLLRGRLSWAALFSTLKGTVQTTAMIFMIVIGAQIFNTFLATTGVPTALAEWIAGLPLSRWFILSIILALYVPLGMLMDALPMILLTLPTLFPIIRQLGFDPIFFGVLVCIMCELANISPPMGMNIYIIKGVAKDVPIEEIILGCIPFALMMVALVLMIMLFPEICLILPQMMK